MPPPIHNSPSASGTNPKPSLRRSSDARNRERVHSQRSRSVNGIRAPPCRAREGAGSHSSLPLLSPNRLHNTTHRRKGHCWTLQMALKLGIDVETAQPVEKAEKNLLPQRPSKYWTHRSYNIGRPYEEVCVDDDLKSF
ncbi:hypothetical protein BDK51DRAFT_43504 [Blyttiomyces helicus]|uniref:Uncharacterized protein n=1 Tax=Blyttiomyces helicus TaxID=388810 RepID=A0A4P9WFK8_9FUNG|nr:hypothetical protein BDK51DRAFT_43504 [Blyttiomyces helicus]|eukprot:RKO90098.1 hypothetical protein BDK51DRAFT_43504 [Blyttiomyces helicus]